MNNLQQIELERVRAPESTADWLQPYVAQVRKDAPFHWAVAVYALAGLLISIAAGVPHKFAPIRNLGLHLGIAFMVPIVIVLIAAGVALTRLASSRPEAS